MTAEPSATTAGDEARRWPAGPIFFLGIVLFVVGEMLMQETPLPQRLQIAAVLIGLMAIWWAARSTRSWWWPRIRAALDAHDEAVDAISVHEVGRCIVLTSGIDVFVELMLIRWHGSMFHLFAIYKNVSLLAAFLGLGIGYARGALRHLGGDATCSAFFDLPHPAGITYEAIP